jgi:hypothetical protein
MDKIILRPASSLVSDPRNGTINTLQSVREKLLKKKYTQFLDWKEDVLKVFKSPRPRMTF